MKKQLVIFSVLFILSLCSFSAAAEVGPFVGDKILDFTLNDLHGKPVKLSNLRKGKTALIFFWASWCKDSKAAMPQIQDAYQKYDTNKLLVIGVNTGVRDSISLAKNFKEENKISLPLVFDKDSLVSNKLMVMGTPRFFLVNKDGMIIYSSGKFPEHLSSVIAN